MLKQVGRKTTSVIHQFSRSTWLSLKLTRDYSSSALPYVVADKLYNNDNTPWLLLPPVVDEKTGEKQECFYKLGDNKTVRLNRNKSLKVPDTAICKASTLGSWLAFADTKDASLYLSNPFLNDVVQLPSLATLPRVVGVQNHPTTGSVLHFNVSYTDSEVDGDASDADSIYQLKPEEMADTMIRHLALSNKDPRDPHCVAMACQDDRSRLAYCDIGKISNNETNNKVWHGLQEDYKVVWNGLLQEYYESKLSCQVAYSSKTELFYALMRYVGFQAYDVQRDRSRRSKKVADLFIDYDSLHEEPKWLKKMHCEVRDYLVTLDNGDLLLILRYAATAIGDPCYECDPPYETVHINVFKVAYPGRLERVTCLEDLAIFVGLNQSFSVKASRGEDGTTPKIRPNSIYFTDDHLPDILGHDMGVFNMKNGTITPFYEEENKVPSTNMPLFWIAPL